MKKTPSLKIELVEYLGRQPNGDRATFLSPCSDFKVELVKDGSRKVMKTFSQFNAFWTAVLPRGPIYRDAKKYAEEMAETLECEVIERKMREKVIPQETQWEEVK